MKKLNLALLLIGFLTLSSCNDDDDSVTAPTEVSTAFQQKYPNAQIIEWELKSNNIYEAEYVDESQYAGYANFDSYFKADGTWIYTNESVSYQNLPTVIQEAYTNSKYTPANGWVPDSSEVDYLTLDSSVTSFNGHNGPIYSLEVEHVSTKEDRKLRFDETGALLLDSLDSVEDFNIIVSNLK